MNLLLSVFLLTLFSYAEPYRVLVVNPMYIKSLNILGYGAVKHLLNDGHEVTFVATHPMSFTHKNLRQIDISDCNIFEGYNFTIDHLFESDLDENSAEGMQEMARENAALFFSNKNVIKLLQDTNEHFDAVVVDLYESEVYGGLAVLYNCPMIWLYSMGAHWQVLRLIADPGNPAYDADYLGTNIAPLNFVQRIEEMWARIKWTALKTFVTLPIEQKIYEDTFRPVLAKRGRELPDYKSVIYNASLIFGNEHQAIIGRASTPQNFKYIGGFHVEESVKPLPKNLQDLMDNAPHGVIYFSMGSLLQSKAIPKQVTKGLLKIFGELKETVIWKYEDDLTEDVPKNVHTVKWAPQQSILAHPNCLFFITHGGLLSSIESIHFGVPIIGIPVFFDQFTNIQKSISNGYALGVKLGYDLPEELKPAINTMLSDNSYRKRAKELSSIYHDTPVKPGAELVHWVRHVIQTKGAPHLRSPAWHVPLCQRLYLDLIGLLIGSVIILYITIKRLFIKPKKIAEKKKKN